MPVVGPAVQVTVAASPVGGTLVLLWNRSGSRRRIDVNGQVFLVDGNTRAGVAVEAHASEVRVTDDRDGLLWPVRSLG